jgi:DnaJ-class molecular chaperone
MEPTPTGGAEREDKMSETRKCRACEGRGWRTHMVTRLDTGEKVPHTGRGAIRGPWARMLKACQMRVVHTSAREWLIEERCPVCLGSGQVEAKPSVRDAVPGLMD